MTLKNAFQSNTTSIYLLIGTLRSYIIALHAKTWINKTSWLISMNHKPSNNAYPTHKGSNKSNLNAQNEDKSTRGNKDSQDNPNPNHPTRYTNA